MSTIIRRRRTSRLEIGPYKRFELLSGEVRYPAQGYSGYGDGIGTDLTVFISGEMRSDWANNRVALIEFWKSGRSTVIFPDCLPWVDVSGSADTLPWAATHLEPSHADLAK